MCWHVAEWAPTWILATLRSFRALVISLTTALKPSSSIASQMAWASISCDLKVTCITNNYQCMPCAQRCSI